MLKNLPRTMLATALLTLFALLPSFSVAANPSTHVHIQDSSFRPQTVAIATGEAIDWDNHDLIPHTATADDGSFDSGVMGTGDTFAHTFNTAGIFGYFCSIHGFTGTVIVVDPTNLPELVVGNIAVYDGQLPTTKLIDVTVRNLGGSPAAASTTEVVYRYQGEDYLIGKLSTPEIPAGDRVTVRATWNVEAKVGDFAIAARADSENLVDESEEGNNEATSTASVIVGGMSGIDVLDPI